MAKISARGCHKLAEATFDFPRDDSGTCDHFGPVLRHVFVLRSDGHILSCTSHPQAADSYDRRRSGLTLWKKFKAEVPASEYVERFAKIMGSKYEKLTADQCLKYEVKAA
jgi:hypothetical protein